MRARALLKTLFIFYAAVLVVNIVMRRWGLVLLTLALTAFNAFVLWPPKRKESKP